MSNMSGFSRERQIRNYAIWFGIYLGVEGDDTETEEIIMNLDMEEVSDTIWAWAEEFVDSDLDDSTAFFNKKLEVFLEEQRAKDQNIVYTVIGHSEAEDTICGIFKDPCKAVAEREKLQKEADKDVAEFECDSVFYEVKRYSVTE